MEYKRITLFAGHYGSGKTNIAVNWALEMKKREERVMLADMDIVNPYYRAKDSADEVEKAGIRMISSFFANSNVDLPALPQDIYAIVDDKSWHAIIDVGGDDRGALALGRLVPQIAEENNYEMIFVANFFRPLTSKAEEAYEVMKEIETASSLKFTSIVNNSNLGDITDAEAIISTFSETEKLSELSGLPVLFTSCEKKLYEKMKNTGKEIFPLELQSKIY